VLTDAQWTVIEPLLPPPRRRRDGKGRPPASSRACFEGILWVPRSGARWRDLPRAFPSPATCWRRLRGWEEQGVWLTAWRELLGTLDARGRLEWEEAFLDGSFVAAKKGASPRHDEARQGHQVGTKWMVLVDGRERLWESTSHQLPRLRSGSPRRRSHR
jgi:transposase